MAYDSSILKHIVTILVPEKETGRTGQHTAWREGSKIHAAIDWSKGVRALRQGDVTAYETVLVRCRYTSELTPNCRLLADGKYYVLSSLNASRQDNTVQMTAVEIEPFTYLPKNEETEE